jgi:rSAM/selenodomain-associated transferase 1
LSTLSSSGSLPRRQLLIFAKYPRTGQVKTRLSPPLAPEDGARLYRAFLLDALDLYGSLSPSIEPVLLLADERDVEPMRLLLGEEGASRAMTIGAQRGEALGERLINAFADAFAGGASAACAIGTDHPTLPLEYVVDAFDALAGHDLAIGPADDGGYYLLALRERRDELFERMPYSTAALFAATMSAAAALALSTLTLPLWYDVDDGASLARLRSDRALLPAGSRTARVLDELDNAGEIMTGRRREDG